MIFETGTQRPTTKQKRIVREIADSSFTALLPIDFGNLPVGTGWRYSYGNAIAIKMRCVDPHRDDFVGIGQAPRKYAAVFWLTSILKYERIAVQVGTKSITMGEGDFMVFDDRVLHCVCSDLVWRGCAYQVRPNSKTATKRREA
jgi:hypothetical protein